VTSTFITVLVDEHDDLPEGCCMRFKAVGTPRIVRRVRVELARQGPLDEDGSPGEWTVESCGESGDLGPAHGILVEDSSAGSSLLIYGGAHGLRLRPAPGSGGGGSVAVAEPYLLVADRAVIE
jgi:hypothetical protein